MNAAAPEGYLLSPQQRRMLASRAGNRGLLLKISGVVQEEKIRRALTAVVARHEILRTRFDSQAGPRHARQFIEDDATVVVTENFHRVRDDDGADPMAWHRLELERRHDDASAVPWRITPMRGASSGCWLSIVASSLLADWRTLEMLVRELAEAYADLAPSNTDPFQYADYATWQEDCRASRSEGGPAMETGAPPLFHKAESLAIAPGSGRKSIALDALQPGLDPAILEAVCLIAVHAVIGRLTGQMHPQMGVAIDGRLEPDLQGMMGPTEKVFPFSATLEQTFCDLQAAASACLTRCRQTFDGYFPEPPYTPEVTFHFLETHASSPASASWQAERVLWSGALHQQEKLGILCEVHGGMLTVDACASTALLDFSSEDLADYVSQQVLHLCQAAVHTPEAGVLAVPLAVPEGMPALPDFAVPIPIAEYAPVTVSIHRWVRESPEAVAVTSTEAAWSYRDLWTCSEGIGRQLVSLGLARGDRVAILGEGTFSAIAAMVGTLRSGGVTVPMDRSLPVERLASMARIAAVRFLIVISAEVSAPEWADAAKTLHVSSHGDVTGDVADSVLPPTNGSATEEPAYVFFTSGTSGTPKGILGNHRGLAHFIHWQGTAFRVTAQDRVAQLTGLSFDVVLRDVFLPLCHGATLCLPPRESIGVPTRILEWMKLERITLLHTVPSIARWWLDGGESLPRPASLRCVFFAGEPLRASLVSQWRNRLGTQAEIINLYGPTETTLAKCWYRVPEDASPRIQPIGTPLPATQVCLWNVAGTSCAPGEPGEIVIRTPYRTSGYLDGSSSGRSGFVSNPHLQDAADLLYRTGDLGRMRRDGLLEIEGRVDDQVKIRGVRIMPAEVEAHLQAHPDIEKCAVIVRRDASDNTPTLLAFVMGVDSAGPPDASTILRTLRQHLPDAMVPEQIMVVTQFPRTANGKLDRQRLLELAKGQPSLPGVASVPPVDDRQRLILAAWQEVFHRSDIGITENFFALGGHSLLAAQLAARLRDAFHRVVPLGLVFEAPTVAELAVRIASLPVVEEAPTVIAASGEACAPLSSSQMRIWLQQQMEPGTGAYNLPIAVRITGDLGSDQIRRCVEKLTERHAILRTVFMEEVGQPFQRVLPEADLTFRLEDFSSMSAEEAERSLGDAASEEARRPFHDLATRPPVRVVLAKMNASSQVLVLTLHHLVGDGWSSVLLLKELALLCHEHGPTGDAPLDPLPFQYADYARWEQSRKRPEALAQGLEWWSRRLEGIAALPAFPTDFLRTPRPSRPGAEVSIRLTDTLTAQLRQLGRSEDASFFMTLLAAFHAYLFRLTGHADVVIGTPVAIRPTKEAESLVGCFINTLPLRGRLAAPLSFHQFLRHTREMVFADFQHLDCPFEEIVRVAQPVRRRDAHPLFQVLFNVLNFEALPASGSHLHFERVFPAVPGSKFDWTVYVREGSQVELQFLYDADLFDQERMISRAAGFVDLLAQVARDPHRALSEYAIEAACVFPHLMDATPSAEEDVHGAAGHHPSTDARIEQMVRSVWRRHLKSGLMDDADENFFDVGGHSLLAMQLIHDLGRELGRNVPLRAIFDHPTIKSLSSHLALLAWHAESRQEGADEWEL
jgi:amino acid adenylation domain-containing protein